MSQPIKALDNIVIRQQFDRLQNMLDNAADFTSPERTIKKSKNTNHPSPREKNYRSSSNTRSQRPQSALMYSARQQRSMTRNQSAKAI